jgi:hypothetical protein
MVEERIDLKAEEDKVAEDSATPTADDTPTVTEATDVQEVDTPAEKPAPKPRKKAVGKKKSKASATKSKRSEPSARPVAPPPPPLTLSELKEQGVQAKQELVSAVLEPALEAAGSLSQTIRDTIGGAFAGLLSRKRRD